MEKRDSLYLQNGMVEYNEAYVEKATDQEVQKRLKQGKGSQKQAVVAVVCESTPLEDPESGKKTGIVVFSRCKCSKMSQPNQLRIL